MTASRHTSFRDPAGQLRVFGTDLIRSIKSEFADEYHRLLDAPWLHELMQTGDLVATERLNDEDTACILLTTACERHSVGYGLYLRHERIPFASFPTEWPLEMLCAAADLTLRICTTALRHSVGLKDATPYNVLFRGPRPVFVDLLSFENRLPQDPTWLACGQFVRSFQLPALLDSYCGIPCHTTFWSQRDGIEPEEVYRLLSSVSRWLPPFLGPVTLPVLLSSFANRQGSRLYDRKMTSSVDRATFMLESQLKRLHKSLRLAVTRRKKHSAWLTYCNNCTYDDKAFAQKSACVERWLFQHTPERVLDVGCNTGVFSFIAAQSGAEVVAIDSDPTVVGSLWSAAQKEQADILPLVINLSRPTPALGWCNAETPSFLERAKGHFNAVLMLAVVHHLLVTEGIPIDEIFALAADLTRTYLIIEFVGPDDTQFKRLVRGRDYLYLGFSRDTFEKASRNHFVVLECEQVGESGRWLYLMSKHNVAE